MRRRQHAFEVRLGDDVLFLRSDMDRLCAYKNQWSTARHCNAEYELHIILRGVTHIDVEEHHYTLREQQAILIAPNQYHLPKPLPGEFERFSISFALAEGRLLQSLRRQVPLCRVFSITEEMAQVCQCVFRECAVKNAFRMELRHALLSQLIIRALRLLRVGEGGQTGDSAGEEAVRTDRIDKFFEENFARRAGQTELADQLHLSRRQLARVLQEHYGMGFQEKLLSARMDHAAWLLRTTDKQVGQISGAVGYESEAAFYQAFRTHFHMTPREYRLQVRSRQEE